MGSEIVTAAKVDRLPAIVKSIQILIIEVFLGLIRCQSESQYWIIFLKYS
jgi:hypothetical protein